MSNIVLSIGPPSESDGSDARLVGELTILI